MTDQPDQAQPGDGRNLTEERLTAEDRAAMHPEPPRFDVNAALRAVLEATRDAVRAGRTRDLWRDRLDREARRRYAQEESAPSWNTPNLGKVRLDPKPATPHVTDPDALATYVLGIAPTEVTATIELDGADLEEALTALEFAGVKVHRSTAAVRPAYLAPFLADLELVEGEAPAPGVALRCLDELGTVEEVPGVGVTPASATLVVTIDPALKRETLARVDHELADAEQLDELRAAAGIAPPSDADEAHAFDVGQRLIAKAQAAGLPLDTAGRLAAEAAASAELPAPGPDLTRLEDPTPLDEAASRIGALEDLPAAAGPELSTASIIDRQRAAASARAAQLTADHEARLAAASARAAQLDADHAANVARYDRSCDACVRGDGIRPHTCQRIPAVGELHIEEVAARHEQGETSQADTPPYTARPGMQFRPDEPPAPLPSLPPDDVEPLPIHTLATAYKSDALKRACRRATLSATGPKHHLAERLHNAGVTAARMKELTAP